MPLFFLTTNPFSWSVLKQTSLDFLASLGGRVLLAGATLIIGLFLIDWFNKLIRPAFRRAKVEPTAATFLDSFIDIALKVLLAITIVLQLGVKETSVVALLGTTGLAIGMALQGSLSNFAGGVLILILKPFKVGDFIEVQSISGKIEKIQVFHSYLLAPDNKRIAIPNGTLINSIVVNHSAKPTRRVEIIFQVGYNSDINQVKTLLMSLLVEHPKVLKDPEPFLRMSAQASSSLNFTARVWVKSEDYWDVTYDLIETSKQLFDQAGIEIPYNKLDVNLKMPLPPKEIMGKLPPEE